MLYLSVFVVDKYLFKILPHFATYSDRFGTFANPSFRNFEMGRRPG